MYALVQRLRQQGHTLPLLLRFIDILAERVSSITEAFASAITQTRYTGVHRSVYPIKVNQQRSVIERIVAHPDNAGLEVGSKSELLCALATVPAGSMVICNGYKDREYIRLALIGMRMGLRVYIVIEKLSDLPRVVAGIDAMQVTPFLGLRVRLGAVVHSNWQNTGGEKSKFGLAAGQVLQALDFLRQKRLLSQLQLLHFHAGSQISHLSAFAAALQEGTRYYRELRQMQVPIAVVDVGGGLGVDYEGGHSANYCSMDYTVADYAKTVVAALQSVCEEGQIPEPDIITECGRAITAHHAVLVTNMVEVDDPRSGCIYQKDRKEKTTVAPLLQLQQIIQLLEGQDETAVAWKDLLAKVEDSRQQMLDWFLSGRLNLYERALAEEYYYQFCEKLLTSTEDIELQQYARQRIAKKCIANFSLFQSMPDSWAIDAQIFPVMPIHRLHESDCRPATVQDLTCDSDGRIDHYISEQGISDSILLPDNSRKELLLGIFLLGAYQEVLGDMHNLFGTPASVNVRAGEDGQPLFECTCSGDRTGDLLSRIDMDADKMREVFTSRLTATGLERTVCEEYLHELLSGIQGYTYLED